MDEPNNRRERQDSRKASRPAYYEIRVEGQLDQSWSEWFDEMEVSPLENGQTLMAGLLSDQAALQGILTKIFDLKLPLLLVRRIDRAS